MFTVPKHGSTITHEVLGRFDAARVMLRPASDGTGVIAGGGVRAVLELGGVRNVLAKSLGTTNPINMAKATVVALQQLRRPEDVARIRGKQISEVLPLPRIRTAAQEAALADAAAVEPKVVEEAPKPKKRAAAKPKVEQAPVEEAVVEAAPAEEAVVEEAPAKETAVVEAPVVEEAPAKVAIPPTPPAEEALASKPKRRGLRKKKDD
jgi:small subunit ribosomal protein S5